MINGILVSIAWIVSILIIVLLLVTVIVSVVRNNNNENVQLISGQLGQSCYYSPCATSYSCDYTSFECKFATAGVCVQGSDCVSGLCVSGRCVPSDPIPPPNPDDGQLGSNCAVIPCLGTSLTCNSLGVSGKKMCMYIAGETCTNNTDCDSFNCESGVCQTLTPNGYPCLSDSSCVSGNCSNSDGSTTEPPGPGVFGICQPTGIFTGTNGSNCVTDLYGGGDNFVPYTCDTGLTCTGTTPSNLFAGTCQGQFGFGATCTSASQCAPQFDCTVQYSGTANLNTYCLFNDQDPMIIGEGKVCVSPFVPTVTGGLTICQSPSFYTCSVNGNCQSSGNGSGNGCSKVGFNNNLQLNISSLNILPDVTSLLNTSEISMSLVRSSYQVPLQSLVPSSIETLLQYNADGAFFCIYYLTQDFGNFVNINVHLMRLTSNESYDITIPGAPIPSGPLPIFVIGGHLVNFGTVQGNYTFYYYKITDPDPNVGGTISGSGISQMDYFFPDISGSLNFVGYNSSSSVFSYGNFVFGSSASVNITKTITPGSISLSNPIRLQVYNAVPYLFYISTGGAIVVFNVTSNSIIYNKTVPLGITLFQFCPVILNNIVSIYGTIQTSGSTNTAIITLFNLNTNADLGNVFVMPGDVTSGTLPYIVGSSIGYVPESVCS